MAQIASQPGQRKYLDKLRGKRVLIVGGSSGIGFAVAEAVLEFGGEVTISSSSPQKVENAVAKLKATYPNAAQHISGFPLDLSNEPELDTNVGSLFKFCGHLDHVVFTAGEPTPAIPLAEATVENIKQPFTVRYVALVIVAKWAAQVLPKSAESSITLTTGIVTDKPIPGWSVIAGPRSAVVGLSTALALDLKPIRVNVVAVGVVDTDTWAGMPSDKKATMFDELAGKFPTGKVAKAEDVAENFLAAMRDTNVTGSVFRSYSGALLV